MRGCLHLAIGLFVTEEATLGQAAETAGLSQAEFLRELGKRRIPIHYGRDELNADLEAIELAKELGADRLLIDERRGHLSSTTRFRNDSTSRE